jgi:lysophospholipase L1-like esterase
MLTYLKTGYLIATVTPYEQPGTTPPAGNIKIIGDSTGYGTGAGNAMESVAGRIGAAYPCYRITNDSVNGRTITDLLQADSSADQSYDLILLQIGANDLLQHRSVDEVLNDMNTLIERLQPQAAHLAILTSGNIGGTERLAEGERQALTDASREYDRRMQDFAAKQPNVQFVSLFSELDDDPFVQDPDRYQSWDGLHPSSEGYRLWFEAAEEQVLTSVLAPC